MKLKFRKTNQGTTIDLKPIVKKVIKLVKDKCFVKDMQLKMVN